MPNSIFFSQKGDQKFPIGCKLPKWKLFKYKNWMCNAQIPKDKIRGRVVVNKSLNKILI